MAGITVDLWTLTRFLSKHAVKDTYGVIETPETSGLIPTDSSNRRWSVADARLRRDSWHEPGAQRKPGGQRKPNTDARVQSIAPA